MYIMIAQSRFAKISMEHFSKLFFHEKSLRLKAVKL